MTKQLPLIVAALLMTGLALAPAAMAQPPGNGGDGPAGAENAEGERGLERAMQVVPDFVKGILQGIMDWFTPDDGGDQAGS